MALGGFALSYSSGLLNPLSIVLTVVGVFALAAALAPSKGTLLSVSLAMSIGPLLVAIYGILSALSGGRSDFDPDPIRDLFLGLSMAFVVGAVWFHFAHVRSGRLASCRVVYLCVGLAFVSTAIPDLLSEYRQPIGLRYLVIGLLPITFAAFPNRVTVALMVVGLLVGIVRLGERYLSLIDNPEIVALQLTTSTALHFIGMLLLFCAVGVQLIKAFVDGDTRMPPAQRGFFSMLKGS